MDIHELGSAAYTGTVIDNSGVPALLGLRTMRRMNGGIDTRRKHRNMHLYDNVKYIDMYVRPGACAPD
eukprot:6197610-Prorocentrum_lima.AAC.1